MRSATRRLCLATSLAAVLAACGGDQSVDRTNGGPAGEGKASAEASGAGDASSAEPSVRTAEIPADPCGWIPVSEVEAVVGKLAGPPKRQDGCRYTLVMPETVSAKRQEAIDRMEKLNARLKAAFKDYEPPDYGGPMANFQGDPATYAVTLSVDVSGSMAGELGTAAAVKHLESWLPPRQRGTGGPDAAEPAKPEGWDSLGMAPYGFSGRTGHIQISVLGQAPDVPRDLAKALAERVRDRIPDLPFPADNPYQVIQLGQEPTHPCGLLTRAEAEAVLGPLAVEPYRASSEWPSLALGTGHGCAFYTAGHHVFSIVPEWTDGEQTFKLAKGIGGLVSTVLPQEMVVFKGPWDQAHIDVGTGALMFLKGDRLLQVHYLTSSTDRKGALKLAAQAMKRMAS